MHPNKRTRTYSPQIPKEVELLFVPSTPEPLAFHCHLRERGPRFRFDYRPPHRAHSCCLSSRPVSAGSLYQMLHCHILASNPSSDATRTSSRSLILQCQSLAAISFPKSDTKLLPEIATQQKWHSRGGGGGGGGSTSCIVRSQLINGV